MFRCKQAGVCTLKQIHLYFNVHKKGNEFPPKKHTSHTASSRCERLKVFILEATYENKTAVYGAHISPPQGQTVTYSVFIFFRCFFFLHSLFCSCFNKNVILFFKKLVCIICTHVLQLCSVYIHIFSFFLLLLLSVTVFIHTYFLCLFIVYRCNEEAGCCCKKKSNVCNKSNYLIHLIKNVTAWLWRGPVCGHGSTIIKASKL